ncbi:pyruvate formate-lyase-activating protein [Alteromonas sp. ASW11-36]|uniref:Pyruvate formate-lyase-activating enzyme n=1 Tax=Alteromonas arenosi TaxID=3055817 RepID=A0ABT7SUG3_9ALTE|nr:pyruvate formate-lyase-activating protein [Alteromonas sp. ASW11-36]MDM7859816.1 pyruvate formate-lyase-activating protein [Alteromonas sp. ASW11-36]
MTVSGFIHSKESFSTVDGPGVRYVVFLQSCQLRCLYCENRDTWDRHLGTVYSVDALVEDILKYRQYIQPHGGVTVSGGEPTLQLPFIIELFKRCQALGIHTALDTNGYIHKPDAQVLELLEVTDLVLLDIKAMSNPLHVELTSVNNHDILKFAQFLGEHQQPMWIRHVVVPGYTDTIENISALAAFIQTLTGVEQVELLPYHELGKHKWAPYTDKYPLEGTPTPDKQTMQKLTNYLLDRKIPALF